MEFNVLNSLDTIKSEIVSIIKKKSKRTYENSKFFEKVMKLRRSGRLKSRRSSGGLKLTISEERCDDIIDDSNSSSYATATADVENKNRFFS